MKKIKETLINIGDSITSIFVNMFSLHEEEKEEEEKEEQYRDYQNL